MNIAFYSGASGLMAYQSDMDTIAHNIANVNTTGYKPSRSVFSDLLYSRMAVNTEEDFLVGHGVRVEDKDLMFRQGAVIPTGNPLDFGIIGDGFFAVQRGGSDEIQYTRNGAFSISVEDGCLVTSDGWYVLNADGDILEVPRLERPNGSSGSGELPYDLSAIAGELGVYHIPNPFGLEPASGGRFLVTENTGEPQLMEPGDEDNRPYRVVSSALENSAVELSDEMVMVIQTQKAFQFSARLVQTADQLEEIVNNLR